MHVVAWFGFAAGVVILLLTGSSVVKTLLIPRNVSAGLTTFVGRIVASAYRVATGRIAELDRRERVHAAGAPTFLLTLLTTWVALLYLGFALLLWPYTGANPGEALRASGSSLFTLGFATPAGAAPLVIVFVAAASGYGIIAMLISYLPALYGSFNRRETLVTMLDALAGTPPWGPELLARHALIGNTRSLPRLYERWTEWAADISESHTTYYSLIYFRSPDPERSWFLALLAVLDAAALHLSLCPRSAPAEARPLMRVGYLTVQLIAATLGLPVNEDPLPSGPLTLTRAQFDEATQHMREAGCEFECEPDQAWLQFRGWRVNYEAAGQAVARYLDLPPALWSGARDRTGLPGLPRRPAHRSPGAEGIPSGPGGPGGEVPGGIPPVPNSGPPAG
jgi:hypothetical protein